LKRCGLGDRSLSVFGRTDDVESLLRKQRRECISREGMVVHDQDAFGHVCLIGTTRPADKRTVDGARLQSYRSWLLGEILLIGLLASGTALFAASESLQSAYELHDARIAFDSAVAVVAATALWSFTKSGSFPMVALAALFVFVATVKAPPLTSASGAGSKASGNIRKR